MSAETYIASDTHVTVYVAKKIFAAKIKKLFKHPPDKQMTAFYFGGGSAPLTLASVFVLLPMMLYIVFTGDSPPDWWDGDGPADSADDHHPGTDRPASEDEAGRRMREREGGSREAVDGGRYHWASMSDRELLNYYHERYGGLDRRALKEADPQLYQALQRRGLLYDVPTANGRHDWASMTDYELLRYYREHYAGVPRGKLQTIDRSFYDALRHRELLDEIPTNGDRMIWSSMSDRELLRYYHDHYEGVSRGGLARADRALYQELRRRGLLDEIPTAKQLNN